MKKKKRIIVTLLVQDGRDRGFGGEYPSHLVDKLNDALDLLEAYDAGKLEANDD